MQDTITYDPEADNCAGSPVCGVERVLFIWYSEPVACCPRCYENLFGGSPEPWRVVKIPDTPDGGWPTINLRLAERTVSA